MKKISISLILSVLVGISSAIAQTIADGQRYTRNEEFEKAEQVYKDLITKKPKVGDNYYWAGLNYLAKGDSLNAVKMFNDGLGIAPTNPYNLIGKGHMELRKFNTQGAEVFFAQASAAKKKLRPVLNKEIARAYLLVEFGSSEQLKAYASRAIDYLKISNNDFEAKILLGDAMVIQNPTNSSDAIQQYIVAGYDAPSDPRPILRQAKVYARASAYTLSIAKLDEALALDVNFAPAYRQKAEVFSLMKERDSAVYYYEEYLRRNDNITARKFYVQTLYLGGDFDRCISEGNKLLAVKSIPNIYGVIAYAIAEKDKAKRRLIDSALNYYFFNYEQLYVKPQGRELQSSEKFIKAILMYRSGLASGNDTTKQMMAASSYSILSMVLSDTGKSSIKSYQRIQDMYFNGKSYEQAYGILELKRKKLAGVLNSRDLYFEGRCLAATGKNAAALKIYQELVANDTNYLTGYYLIATTWAGLDPNDSTGNVTAAFERWMSKLDSAQRVKFVNDRENAYRNMAFFAQKRKDYEKASYYYGKVIEIRPEDEATIAVKKRIDDYMMKVKAKANKQKPATTPASTSAGTTTGSAANGASSSTPANTGAATPATTNPGGGK
jgi:tetratricopeptide (TPR) repeat protein